MKIGMTTIGVLLVLGACGKKDDDADAVSGISIGDPETSQAASASIDELGNDLNLITLDVGANVEEAISAIAGGDFESTGTSLALHNGGKNLKEKAAARDEQGECSFDAGEGKTTVTISRSGKSDFSFTRGDNGHSHVWEYSADISRVWSRTGVEIPCNAEKTAVNWPVKSREGTTLASTVKRQSKNASSITKDGVTSSRSWAKSVSGSHTTTWTSVSEADKVLSVSKEVSLKVEKTALMTNKENQERKLQSTVEVSAASPLKVNSKFSEGSDIPSEIIVASGVVTSTNKNGGKIELSYENVKYLEESKCQPVEGKITGKIFKADATDASDTFSIDFSQENPKLIKAGGDSKEFSTDGCEFGMKKLQRVEKIKDSVREKVKEKIRSARKS